MKPPLERNKLNPVVTTTQPKHQLIKRREKKNPFPPPARTKH